MSKGWTTIYNINNGIFNGKEYVEYVPSTVDLKRFDNTLKITKKIPYKDLVQEGQDAYLEIQAKEAALLAAYNEKRLKSPRLIKEAKDIISERAAAKRRAEERAAKKKAEQEAAEKAAQAEENKKRRKWQRRQKKAAEQNEKAPTA